MYESVVVALGVLCLFFGAYAARMKRRAAAAVDSLREAARCEAGVLEGVRVMGAASRESAAAVFAALDRTLRVVEPSIDTVLVFVREADELACAYAGGDRAEYFDGSRVRCDDAGSLAARAACSAHRVELTGDCRPIVATDRAALAMPMIGRDGVTAVVYAATVGCRIAHADALVSAVAQAASAYALAVERESDRRTATYDGLTGLYTPRAFRVALQEELAVARLSAHASLALWFVDTDHFKQVNDTLGHGAGDAVLVRMAALLREHTLAGIDLAARNGGDEFCAIVRGVQKIEAIERAQRFCDAVRRCDFGVGMPLTASIGVAAYPYDAPDASELLERADAAMYHSKRAGRDRVSFSLDGTSFAVYSSSRG